MPIIVFSHRRIHSLGARMVRIIHDASPTTVVDMLEDIDTLKKSLSALKAHGAFPMVVLMIDREALLDRLIANRQCLDGLRVILVLPDSHPSRIAKGHKLFPRYITYLDSDWKEILAIVEKSYQSAPGCKTRVAGEMKARTQRLSVKGLHNGGYPEGDR